VKPDQITLENLLRTTSLKDRHKAVKNINYLVRQISKEALSEEWNDIKHQWRKPAESFEFEPLNFQPSSQFLLPKEIQEKVDQTHRNLLTGSLAGQVQYFAFCESGQLALWLPGETSLGIPRHNEGRRMVSGSGYKFYDMHDPIQDVCYFESRRDDFQPFLLVATTKNIKVL